jgi:pyroglutamyl-peptidase
MISAFKPFNKATENHSLEVMNRIKSECFNISKIVLDVTYDESFNELKEMNLDSYDFILALGEARMRGELTVEKQALNLSSCSIADNKGVLKTNEVIDINLPDHIKTNLDLEQIKHIGAISVDAGKYVCNNLYFHLLTYSKEKTLFIHIPNCNNNEDLYNKYAKDIETIFNILIKD